MNFYRPIASGGFNFNCDYRELLPCLPLRPYVHSFWGTDSYKKMNSGDGLVIPDTCMDIIFTINYSQNKIYSVFCALEDEARFAPNYGSSDLEATFAIRFFAWTAAAFIKDSLKDSLGRAFPVEAIFPDIYRQLTPALFDLRTLEERAKFAEKVLLENMRASKLSADLLNAMHLMVKGNGNVKIADIAADIALSQRQLERLIMRDIGCSPKLFQRLIRHQMVYREVLEGSFDPLDAVEKYGYSDQSHLLRDYKGFHLMSPKETLLRLK